MATQEFYIRGATETEARGPFTHEQLVAFADNRQIDPATLYYDAGNEQWVAFGTNAELMTALFPEKKKLKLGKKNIQSLNSDESTTKEISVDDLLAAADGLTKDTKGKQAVEIDQGRCAKIGLWSAVAALLISAAGLLLPSIDSLLGLDFATIFAKEQLAILGLVDLVLTIALLLQVIAVYPLIRFRALLGLGWFGFMAWSQGLLFSWLLPLLAGSLGLYFCTVCLSYAGVGLASLAALAGMAGVTWLMLH
jgi:hypothetical protein